MLDVFEMSQTRPVTVPGYGGSVLVVSCTAHGHGSVAFVGGSGDLLAGWLEMRGWSKYRNPQFGERGTSGKNRRSMVETALNEHPAGTLFSIFSGVYSHYHTSRFSVYFVIG